MRDKPYYCEPNNTLGGKKYTLKCYKGNFNYFRSKFRFDTEEEWQTTT